MTHNHGKIDAAQSAIVAALRKVGATVQSLADIGRGCPDLLVGFRSRTYLFEVKTARIAQLTQAEAIWHADWRGQPVYVVHDAQEALTYIGAYLSELAP